MLNEVATERMRVTSAGNVGIGTTSPSAKLHTNLSLQGSLLSYLNGTSTTFDGAANLLVVHNSPSMGSATAAGLTLANNDKSVNAISPVIAFSAKSSSNAYNHTYAAIYGVRTGSGADSNWTVGDLVFATNYNTGPVERVRIKGGTGNVGIGIDSPSKRLEIKSNTGSGQGGTIKINRTSDLATTQAYITFGSNGFDDEIYLGLNANSQDATLGARHGHLTFNTGSYQPRMRVHSNGDITFCKTDTSVDTNGVFIQAGNDGAVYSSVGSPVNTYHVYNTLNNRYDFYVSYNGTIYARNTTIQSLSDERLKENIQDLTGGLNTILALRPRTFDFKDGSKINSKGFVAQEVEQVLPECVKEFTAGDPLEDGTRYKTVGQDFMPYIVGAIKELKEIIDNQQQEIESLKAQLNG